MTKKYVCLNCGYVVLPDNEGRCPICKSTNLTDKWDGLIIVLDPEHSEIAKLRNIKKKGYYPVIVKK